MTIAKPNNDDIKRAENVIAQLNSRNKSYKLTVCQFCIIPKPKNDDTKREELCSRNKGNVICQICPCLLIGFTLCIILC